VSAPDFSTVPRRRPPVRDVALFAVSIALLLLSARATLSAHGEREAARARVAEVKREIDAARVRLRALDARGGAGEGPLSQALLTTEAPAARVLAEVAGILPPDVRLERMSLTYGRELALEMAVRARDPRAFDRLLERLDSSPLLRDVRPGAENREGEVRTTVRATWVARP
jgi:hypothetical protein